MVRGDSPSWLRSKAAGDAAEQAVAAYFHRKGYRVYRAVGETEPDLRIETDLEIKRDLLAPKTGNLAIETAYAGAPSSLTTTTALWWCICVGPVALVCKVVDLRRWLSGTSYQTRLCGDGQKALCVLVPVAVLRAQNWVHTLDLRDSADAG